MKISDFFRSHQNTKRLSNGTTGTSHNGYPQENQKMAQDFGQKTPDSKADLLGQKSVTMADQVNNTGLGAYLGSGNVLSGRTLTEIEKLASDHLMNRVTKKPIENPLKLEGSVPVLLHVIQSVITSMANLKKDEMIYFVSPVGLGTPVDKSQLFLIFQKAGSMPVVIHKMPHLYQGELVGGYVGNMDIPDIVARVAMLSGN